MRGGCRCVPCVCAATDAPYTCAVSIQIVHARLAYNLFMRGVYYAHASRLPGANTLMDHFRVKSFSLLLTSLYISYVLIANL